MKKARPKKKRASKSGAKTSCQRITPVIDTEDAVTVTDEYIAFVIAKLLIGVQPTLDPAATYDIIIQMFTLGLAEDNVDAYVTMLRSTMSMQNQLVN